MSEEQIQAAMALQTATLIDPKQWKTAFTWIFSLISFATESLSSAVGEVASKKKIYKRQEKKKNSPFPQIH